MIFKLIETKAHHQIPFLHPYHKHTEEYEIDLQFRPTAHPSDVVR